MSSEVFDLIKFFWKHYNGKGFYLYLFLGCMVLLLFLREREGNITVICFGTVLVD